MTEPAEKAPAAAPPDLTPEERIAALVRGEGAAAPPPALPPPAANDDLPEDVEDPGEEALPIPGPPVNEEALK
ncbi:hypothetical protein NL326_28000, partial [Klebsiella pneumoniae]|nr:hypothetical protein [Klebsiella pneumoniae]